jgi:hypothetical protein
MLNTLQDKELTKEDILVILREIDHHLEGLQRKLKLYCVGGTQLALSNRRTVSKDIDLIVSHEDWFPLSGPVAHIEWNKNIRFDVFPGGALPNYTYPSYAVHARRLPLYFNHLEIYLLDDLDFIITKAISGRSADYEDIALLSLDKTKISKDSLIDRFKNVKPVKGKENEIQSKFQKFITEFYKK